VGSETGISGDFVVDRRPVVLDADNGPVIRGYFTEPHYNRFPAVLVRLEAVDQDELEELLTEAWRIQAPRKLVKEFDAGM
jgi:hypothetical protein